MGYERLMPASSNTTFGLKYPIDISEESKEKERKNKKIKGDERRVKEVRQEEESPALSF